MNLKEQDELFINKRYLGTSAKNYAQYYNHNGVLKRYLPSKFSKKVIDNNNLWIRLNDIPEEFREELMDISNALEEIMYNKTKSQNVLDVDEVKVRIDKDTLLLPVVGRILASDGTPAYTVKIKDEQLSLEPIIVCWNCHWSELFAGITKYENNVFCLASDLPIEQRENFINDMITLREAPEFLGLEIKSTKEKSLELKRKRNNAKK